MPRSGEQIFRQAPLPAAAPGQAHDAAIALGGQLWGRLTELTRSLQGGQSTLAAALVTHAQREGQPVAWVQAARGPLYPPDLAAAGVDVAALTVLHVGPASEANARLRAAEWLLMGGGFGLVVVDVNGAAPTGDAWQGRLLRLTRQHRSAVVLLTASSETAPSLGPLVSLRVQARPLSLPAPIALFAPARSSPQALGRPPFAFDIEVGVLKSKLGPLPGPLTLLRRGPEGLL